MKKWLTMFAAVALAFAVAGCDFSDDEGDVYVDDDWVEDDTWVDDDSLTGECQAGDSGDYFYVMVEDSLTNPSLALDSGCNGNNPGADIDSICVFRGIDFEALNDELEAGNYPSYMGASTVAYEPWADAECDNDKDDPSEVIGAPDGVAADGVFEGYFSLNGGTIVTGFDEEILCGDMIHVIEMYNSDNPEATIEDYKVSLGTSDAGPWTIESNYATGEVIIDVVWEW